MLCAAGFAGFWPILWVARSATSYIYVGRSGSCGASRYSLVRHSSKPRTPRNYLSTDQTCSNGLPGFEASGACCPLSCGRCGGSGCSQLGEGCCTGDVKDSGDLCSETRAAPCIVDGSLDDDDVEGELRSTTVRCVSSPVFRSMIFVLARRFGYHMLSATDAPHLLRCPCRRKLCRAHVHLWRSRNPGQRCLLCFQLRVLRW